MSDYYADVRVIAVSIAMQEVAKDVREDIAGNRGTHIDKYLKRASSPLEAGHNWCGMFVNWCFTEAAKLCSKTFPIGSGTMWSGPKLRKWATAHPDSVVTDKPLLQGDIYVMKKGHIGMVRAATPAGTDLMFTIDGNQSTFTDGGRSLVTRNRSYLDMDVIIRI
jgi:hypothetical protein